MKSISLAELKQKKQQAKPFETVEVSGMSFVVRRFDLPQYLDYIDWYIEQGDAGADRMAKFDRVITQAVCEDDSGKPLFTNGAPSEYLDPGDLVTLGTECLKLCGIWKETGEDETSEKETAKN